MKVFVPASMPVRSYGTRKSLTGGFVRVLDDDLKLPLFGDAVGTARGALTALEGRWALAALGGIPSPSETSFGLSCAEGPSSGAPLRSWNRDCSFLLARCPSSGFGSRSRGLLAVRARSIFHLGCPTSDRGAGIVVEDGRERQCGMSGTAQARLAPSEPQDSNLGHELQGLGGGSTCGSGECSPRKNQPWMRAEGVRPRSRTRGGGGRKKAGVCGEVPVKAKLGVEFKDRRGWCAW